MLDKNYYLTRIGEEITYLGYDRHDYSKNGSPINVEIIERDVVEAKRLGFLSEDDFDIETVALGVVAMYESE